MAHSASRLALIGLGLATVAWAQAAAPSPARPWTKHDYVDFYFSHWNGNVALPYLREPGARAIFERIVNPENILLITAGSDSDEEKLRQITLVLSTMGEIRAAYAYAVLVGEPLGEELTRVQAFTLFVLDAAVHLSKAQFDDPRRKDAWRTTLFGVADALTQRGNYSGGQIVELAAALTAHYPAISPILDESARREFEHRIDALAAAETDPGIRAAYAQLVKAVQSTLTK